MLVRTKATGWRPADPQHYANEVEFQGLVEQTFEQVLDAVSSQPAVIAREVVMPDAGKIDILAVDAVGVITVCECKLQRNVGIRREVVGQIFEYAANLARMSFRELRAGIKARTGEDPIDAMAQRAGEDWDRDTWIDAVSASLDTGRFRLVIAVDRMAPTLKESILYLNSHTKIAVLGLELQRARRDDVEVLVPTLFAEEQSRRKVDEPSGSPAVDDPDTLIVAATSAWPEFQRTGAYICQPERSFREDDSEFLGFYAKRRIEPAFPKIVSFRKNVLFTPANVDALCMTGDTLDAQVAAVVDADLASPESQRTPGERYQVVLLDQDQGFELPHEIRHAGQAAWLRGQRYTSSAALKTHPGTTDELRAAGG